MKKEIEISGKTREEAIEKAVIELGAPSASAIMYTVINEGRKGFLGFGSVDCTIRAVYQVADPVEEKPRRERREREREIRQLAEHDKQMQNEQAAYQHTARPIAETLSRHNGYVATPHYQAIQQRIREFLLTHHSSATNSQPTSQPSSPSISQSL